VVALSDGIVYEVVDPGSPVDSIEIPVKAEPTPGQNPDPNRPTTTPEPESESLPEGRNLPCLGGLLPLALIPLGISAFRFRSE
jgi:hypothetical protein